MDAEGSLKVMTYYFIDYENVNGAGISETSIMQQGDRVEIFYSDSCKNVSLEIIEQLSQKGIGIGAYGVATGAKNALDFQLSTYLGYSVAIDRNASFVIVSKDTGFDKVVDFWKSRKVSISRVDTTASKPKAEAAKTAKTKTKKTEGITLTTKAEMIQYMGTTEYADELLEIMNSYKSKTAINNAFGKYYRDTKKAGTVIKKLKPLLTEKGKS